MIWETLEKLERNEKAAMDKGDSGEKGVGNEKAGYYEKGGGDSILVKVKSLDKAEKGEKIDPAMASEPSVFLKRSPATAWVVTPDFKKEFESELGIKNGEPLVPLYTRLRFFYFLFLLFGADISGKTSKCRVVVLKIIRFSTFLFLFLTTAVYWVQTFLAIKYKYLEYGAALLHLVMASALTSVLVTHNVVNGRMTQLLHMMNKLDSINAAIPIKVRENKVALTAMLCSFLFSLGYLIFPLKWMPGKGMTEGNLNETLPITLHTYCNYAIANYASVASVSVAIFWDMSYLSFFIFLAKRYYLVFRQSYFVMLLNRPTKYEPTIVMQEFRKHHFSICGVVEEMDEIFSPMVLIWYVMLTVCMCCWIRAFDTDAFNSLLTGGIIIASLIISFIQFYALSHGTSLVNDEMNAHLDTVRTMCIRDESPSKSSLDIFQERISHLSYITCILASPVAITGWGFFSISKGFVLTVSSTVLTFTLVLYGV